MGMDSTNSRDGASASPHSGQHKRRTLFGRKETYLITDAKVAPGQDRKRREIQYSILQFLRLPSLLIAGWLIAAYDMWFLPAIIVGVTFPLPWFAVVIGNGRGQKKDKREKNIYKPGLARQMAQREEASRLEQQRQAELDTGESVTIDHEEGLNP